MYIDGDDTCEVIPKSDLAGWYKDCGYLTVRCHYCSCKLTILYISVRPPFPVLEQAFDISPSTIKLERRIASWYFCRKDVLPFDNDTRWYYPFLSAPTPPGAHFVFRFSLFDSTADNTNINTSTDIDTHNFDTASSQSSELYTETV